MKILTAAQIRKWDQYTIEKEPIRSIDLMERAAAQCVKWIEDAGMSTRRFQVFCGKGNNGGDGLAIARMLGGRATVVSVHILESGQLGTEDFQANLSRLHQYPQIDIRFIQSPANFHPIGKDEIVIDALFGSGLNRLLEGTVAGLVTHINDSAARVLSIDMPTGLFTDKSSKGNLSIKATDTLTFQCYKPALLVAENAEYMGVVSLLDIGLHPDFLREIETGYELVNRLSVDAIYRPRNSFSHKGNFGHALIVAGSYGKIGAARLSSEACLRSGAGLVSCHLPICGYEAMQASLPEAMVFSDFNTSFITKIDADLSAFDAIGIGPGLGKAAETRSMLASLLPEINCPLLLDADALNIIGTNPELLKLLRPGTILTPHPKEFERVFGATKNEFDRIDLAIKKSKEYNIIIVLKGHHTFIATPEGRGYFNSTGNAGMATAGSGDVLTGIITGLLAQDYSPVHAALLGVYLHGLAGDIGAMERSMESLIASDIIANLGKAYLLIGR